MRGESKNVNVEVHWRCVRELPPSQERAWKRLWNILLREDAAKKGGEKQDITSKKGL